MPKSTMVYFKRVNAEPIPGSTKVTFTVSGDLAEMSLAEFCDVPDAGFAGVVLARARKNTYRGSTAPLFLAPSYEPDQSQQATLMNLLRTHAAGIPGLPREQHAAQAITEYRKVGSWWEVLMRGQFALAWKNRRWRDSPVEKICVTVYVITIADAKKLADMYLGNFEEFQERRAQIVIPPESKSYKHELEQLILGAMNGLFYPNESFSVVEVDLRAPRA